MPTHKFRIGEIVFLAPALSQNIPGGAYVVTKHLPEERGEFQYRVRSVHEPQERVVRESELMKKNVALPPNPLLCPFFSGSSRSSPARDEALGRSSGRLAKENPMDRHCVPPHAGRVVAR
jgi:hypothetical protein